MKFTVGWLYPDLMNIYGDRGNILTLLKRAEWRGLETKVIEIGRGPANQQMEDVDLFFFGGGQDREQALIYDDLKQHKQESLQRAVEQNGAQVLAVCGGYQLLGHYYQTADGRRFDAIGMIDLTTQAGQKRLIVHAAVPTDLPTPPP